MNYGNKHLREHPFNLKGLGVVGGLCFFLRENIFFWQMIDKKNSVSEMGRKKCSVSTLCLKNIVFVEKKIMSRKEKKT